MERHLVIALDLTELHCLDIEQRSESFLDGSWFCRFGNELVSTNKIPEWIARIENGDVVQLRWDNYVVGDETTVAISLSDDLQPVPHRFEKDGQGSVPSILSGEA